MADNAEHRAMLAMSLQATPAKIADWMASKRLAGNIDFSADAPPQPFFLFRSRCTAQLFNRAHKFMPGNTAKVVVPVQQLHIGIADSREPHAYQRPPRPQFRKRLGCGFQFSIFNAEAEHGTVQLD